MSIYKAETIAVFLSSTFPNFQGKVKLYTLYFIFLWKQISFSSSLSFHIGFTITQNTPTCTAIQEKHISLLLIWIFGALIYRLSLILLKIREISPVLYLHLGCSEWSRIAHGHIYTQLFDCLSTSQPSLETQLPATISHPLGSHLLQWCHTDAARFTSANLVTKQRPWFYQIC